jgi:ABC-type transport system substrate-binding protein
MPSRFTFTCLAFGEDARFERLALLVQRQLADIGIDMRLQPVTATELSERVQKGDFDAFLFELAGRSLTWVYQFWRSRDGGMINSGYTAADATLDRIRMATSDAETRAGIADLARLFHDDPPAAFLAWQTTTRAVSTRFQVEPEANRDIFTNVSSWRLAPGQLRAAR